MAGYTRLDIALFLQLTALVRAAASGDVSSWQWQMFRETFKFGSKIQAPTRPPSSELLVIGAGLPRTGTDSLRMALDHLGYHTYHAQYINQEGHHPMWKDLFEVSLAGKDIANEIDLAINALLEAGYTATTDAPTCLLTAQLAKRFPNAKIILSVRDSPEIWAESFGSTIGMIFAQMVREPLKMLLADKVGPLSDYLEMQLGRKIEYNPGRRPKKESLALAYEYWIDHIQSEVDSSRLLLHNSKDGWDPICKFLEISFDKRPHIPYPYTNSKSDWRMIVAIVCFLSDIWPMLPWIGAVFFIVGTVKLLKSNIHFGTMLKTKALSTEKKEK